MQWPPIYVVWWKKLWRCSKYPSLYARQRNHQTKTNNNLAIANRSRVSCSHNTFSAPSVQGLGSCGTPNFPISYTLWVKKLDPFLFENNFGKYCPILIILSLLQTETRRWHVTISCQPGWRTPQPVRPWKSGRVHLAEGSNLVVLELPYSTEFGRGRAAI